MGSSILVLYGSYRSDRMGIRLANFIVNGVNVRGAAAELVDAKAVELPMLDQMYKEYAPGSAPAAIASHSAGRRAREHGVARHIIRNGDARDFEHVDCGAGCQGA